jgi:hypothetical protein
MKWFLMFTMTLMASVLPMILPAQTADYNKVIALAKTDLAAGHNAEALAGSLKAIQMDASRWEAYLVAGSALQTQKQFDAAMDNYSKALERAPESKKVGVRNVLEQCVREKISASSGPSASAPPASPQGPTFKETLDWLISQNTRAGIKYHIIVIRSYKDGVRKDDVDDSGPTDNHSYFTRVEGIVECAATLFYQPSDDPALYQPIPDRLRIYKITPWLDFTALKPNSIGVKQVVFRTTSSEFPADGNTPALTQISKITPDPVVFYEITGLTPVVNGKQQLTTLDWVTYADQDLANRVAKTLNHAIDVCSGMPKLNPF